jgi:hypothetical protein
MKRREHDDDALIELLARSALLLIAIFVVLCILAPAFMTVVVLALCLVILLGAAPLTPAQRLLSAQTLKAYDVDGVRYPRIRHGDESVHTSAISCTDCAASVGQYHVPTCQHEECPACGGQAISCGCEHRVTVRMLSG